MTKKDNAGGAPDPHENADETPNPAEYIAELQDEVARLKAENEQLKAVDASLADVGQSLIDRIASFSDHSALKGWGPSDCPSEVVGDLLNLIDFANGRIDDLKAENEMIRTNLGDASLMLVCFTQIGGLLRRIAALQLWRDNNPGAADLIYTKIAGIIDPADVRLCRDVVESMDNWCGDADQIPDTGKMAGEVGDDQA